MKQGGKQVFLLEGWSLVCPGNFSAEISGGRSCWVVASIHFPKFKVFLDGIIDIILINVSYRAFEVKIKHAAAHALLFTFFKWWKGEKFLLSGGIAGKLLLISKRGLKHESSGFYFERIESFRK